MKKTVSHWRRLFSGLRRWRELFTKSDRPLYDSPWLEHYDVGVPKEIYIPNITLNDILQRSSEVHRDGIAFSFYGKTYTFSEFLRFVSNIAGALQSLGISKGDRVAFILPNSPQFLFAYWAALRLGAIVVPINPLLSGREVKSSITMVHPRFIFILDLLYEKMQKHLVDVNVDYMCITSISDFMPRFTRFALTLKRKSVGPLETPSAQLVSFRTLCRHAPVQTCKELKPADTAALLFTGGVTGTPKAVQLSHFNLVANVLQTRAWLGNLKDGEDIVLGMLPFFHSYGMTACHHLAIQLGATLILEPRFHVKRAIALSKKHKVTIFPGVPTMYRAIVDEINQNRNKLEYVRFCVSGGAPLNLSLKREFEEVTHSKLVEGYGLSEASPLTHCNPLFGLEKSGSIGLPCPNTEARIVHLDSGKTLPFGAIGELQVKGPQVMKGYWQNERETTNVLSPEGWLSTGDIAQMDKDGFFYIVDRKKDMILSGGFNIYPSEVEEVLSRFPAVYECAVVGAKDSYYGEQVKAFVVLRKNTVCSKEDLQQHCKENMAQFKIPKQITFVDELPKNFLGKVLRRNLIE